MGVRRNVFTIAPGAPFLETFVEAFLAGEIVSTLSRETPPLVMARTTIYVPTQRAARALRTQFARAFDKGATLLPRILPLGGLEERETTALFGDFSDDFDAAALPQIEELERRLLLAQLIVKWSEAVGAAIVSADGQGDFIYDESEPFLVASSPAGAYALAADLSALVDEFIIEDIPADAIDRAIDDSAFDPYWSITTTFLRIALQQWPQMLQEMGRIDASARQKRLIEAQIAKLSESQDHAPVIAIGSTGAQPTTARLLSAIAARDNGAVVLPGLDLDMSDAAWAQVGEGDGEPAFTHPQTMLKRLLGVMQLTRGDVRELSTSDMRAERRRLVSQAMLPADATAVWRDFRSVHSASFDAALDGVALLEAPDEQAEALTLALFLREALETPGQTAALVTPDRTIARRVAAELRRFEIEIDDSGGASLASTQAGALARELAGIGATGLDAIAIASLLAHPLTRLGHTREEIAALAPLVEIGALRGLPASAAGYAQRAGEAQRAAGDWRAHPAARRIDAAQWEQIESLLRDMEAALAPLLALRDAQDLRAFARAHRAAFEAIAQGAEETDDEGALALFDLFERLARADAPSRFTASAYAALFDRIAFETTLRGPRRAHPRLKILGPLEARLIDADLMLLAGLDESIWPPQTETGAFLNRSMRAQLGLSPPERRIGQSAHDFMMGLGATRVVLSRAAKRDGSPTVASRFLTRLEALAGEAIDACRARGAKMLAIATALDQPGVDEATALSRPAPCPPIDLRPESLSVTRIEVLRRDPYAIFAEYILKLKPLDPLGVELGPREIGTAVHDSLETFVKSHPSGPLPPTAREELQEIARARLKEFLADPAFETFVWPRLMAGLDHALDFETQRRAEGGVIFMEKSASWALSLIDGSSFTLTAKADRIEIGPDKRACVFDYKTGKPPSMKQVQAGFAPQLTLEAAMVEAGAFKEIGAHVVSGAAYVGLKDGGKTQALKFDGASFEEVVAKHAQELVKMLSQYRNPETPYPSRPFVALVAHEGDYDHLARVKEWSRGGGEGA
ncbi:double-strand break repair protein AddB [Methylocystis sp. Sn-Cys]|uniref:double-strand break repair protein AddB n=1 Tax=Methylocystis sp. Sn-Cys TaxID=1701263 RepID=UPI00192422C9|nr:double-strand break repair protein AddB [Methylocystis sp. Sn-Cys]MBL1257968.1 double-strand break repair protein AddB [Methylocystis sp. Sn-Cys]